MKKTLEQIEAEISNLEKQYPDQEWRPWCVRGDQTLALEHWGLVQRRIRVKRKI